MRRSPAFFFAVFIALWIGVAAARAALGVPRGLTTEYFTDVRGAGGPGPASGDAPPAALSLVTEEISTDRIRADWIALQGAPPPAFSVRWFGYLTIPRAGFYTFATTSDDGSRLRIGGQTVVDNGGDHGPRTETGRVELDRGPHFVLLEYYQAGGGYEMSWAWAPGTTLLAPVPGWLLSPVRAPYWKMALARALGWLSAATSAGAILTGGWLVLLVVLPPAQRVGGRRPRLASLVLFAALAVVHTWPLATDPGGLSRNDNGDTVLNEWALAWFAHQAPRAPLRLFDANIFYPERYALAYSEALIVQSAFGAPIRWLGGSPVLTYNLVLLAGFTLSAWAMCLVVARWTGDWTAGLASGILFGFNPHTITRLPHLQAQHVEFLPLALLALDALLREPGVRQAGRLALWFTLQALTSVYLLVFSAFALTAAAVARPESWWGARARHVVPYVALAAVLAGLALLPFLVPYWRLYEDQGMSRSLRDAGMYSASWGDYLAGSGRIHRWWSQRWFTGTAFFPGVVGLTLAAIAVARGVAFTDRRARMCLAVGLCGLALSFGVKLPGYSLLYDLLPPLQAIRAPVRFGYLVILAVAALAGFGLVQVRRLAPARVYGPLAAMLLTGAAIEPLAAPLYFQRYDGIPAIYGTLRDEPDAVVAELPLAPPRSMFLNARYMLNSTEHWKPLLNGYSGFVPGSYVAHLRQIGPFPAEASIEALADLGVTHLFVHLNRYRPAVAEELEGSPWLQRIAEEGSIALYRLARPGEAP